MKLTVTPVVAMTIAGSDSGGGAGIAADLHTFASHGVFGTLALTAVTAQNTEKVSDVVAFEPIFVHAQVDAVLSDFSVLVAKTGMLATIAIIDSIANRAKRGELPPLVIDPVMVSSTGASLLEGDGRTAYRRLFQYALVVTPNLIEAEVLCDRSIRDVPAMIDAAKELCALGASYAVIKGGHLDGDEAIDIIYDGNTVTELRTEQIATKNNHGTGCTLSAAIAANLALGLSPLEAIVKAKDFVTNAIRTSVDWELGGGSGSINHFSGRDFNNS